MTPLQITNKYETAVFKSGQLDRFFIARKAVGSEVTDSEARALAREALWLAAKENPKAPTNKIIKKAKRLYSKWLREDFLPTFAQIKRDRQPKLHLNLTANPDDRLELESEVYNCLDYVIRRWGIHLGLWIILSFALQDTQSKAQTIYKYRGIKPTRKQERTALLIMQKLKRLFEAK